jgi:cobalt/nickel transport system permease protein
MLNFPVAAGTSGHLVGGVLAVVLVGPWVGALSLGVVVGVQALFADGGLSALGLNLVNIALVPTLLGYPMFVLARRALPKSERGVVVASGIAGAISVVLSAAAFVVEYSLGGLAPVSVPALGSAMLGVHALIGIGEGVITAMTIGAVLSVRPDLVFGASHLAPIHLTQADDVVGQAAR